MCAHLIPLWIWLCCFSIQISGSNTVLLISIYYMLKFCILKVLDCCDLIFTRWGLWAARYVDWHQYWGKLPWRNLRGCIVLKGWLFLFLSCEQFYTCPALPMAQGSIPFQEPPQQHSSLVSLLDMGLTKPGSPTDLCSGLAEAHPLRRCLMPWAEALLVAPIWGGTGPAGRPCLSRFLEELSPLPVPNPDTPAFEMPWQWKCLLTTYS